jgi:hypothetical protein
MVFPASGNWVLVGSVVEKVVVLKRGTNCCVGGKPSEKQYSFAVPLELERGNAGDQCELPLVWSSTCHSPYLYRWTLSRLSAISKPPCHSVLCLVEVPQLSAPTDRVDTSHPDTRFSRSGREFDFIGVCLIILWASGRVPHLSAPAR